MTDNAFGRETGRKFIYDSIECTLVTEEPNHDQWAVWTEYLDDDGYWYVSDHEGYTLDADEFGPIDDSMSLFNVGDEWSDGVGNYIIIGKTDDGDIVTHDWEGIVDVQSPAEWSQFIREMPLTFVTDESLEDRVASWRLHHPDTFNI